jgi:hypothetical protein
MFSWIRRRLTYANVAMTLALVFAMTGGAYAAKHYLITSTGQISPKVLKQLKGSRGPAGPSGKQGAAGTTASGVGLRSATLKAGDKNCPAGGSVFAAANGTTYACNGEEGREGRNGTNGVSGLSVTATAVPVGNSSKCNELGGSEFVVGGTTTDACNGAKGDNGAKGADGSPWTPNNTLPSGATEKGAWAVATMPAGPTKSTRTAISFTIPMASAPAIHVIPVGQNGTGGGCPVTSAVSKPEAEAGNLCVFVQNVENVSEVGGLEIFGFSTATGNIGEGSTTGEGLWLFAGVATEGMSAYGTWAVTAP